MDALYAEIDELEDHVDELASATLRQRLSQLRHEMLHARRNASARRAAVRRVVDGRLDLGENDALFPREAERAFAETYDTPVRAIEELDVARDLVASVRDYLQSKIAENQSEVVKKLTMVASLVLVPTLITGFYGQNFSECSTAASGRSASLGADPCLDARSADLLPLEALALTSTARRNGSHAAVAVRSGVVPTGRSTGAGRTNRGYCWRDRCCAFREMASPRGPLTEVRRTFRGRAA